MSLVLIPAASREFGDWNEVVDHCLTTAEMCEDMIANSSPWIQDDDLAAQLCCAIDYVAVTTGRGLEAVRKMTVDELIDHYRACLQEQEIA